MTVMFEPINLARQVLDVAAKLYDVPDLNGKNREKVQAKRAAILVLHGFGWSYRRIAGRVGLDHKIVIYHHRIAIRQVDTNPEFRAIVANLRGRLPR